MKTARLIPLWAAVAGLALSGCFTPEEWKRAMTPRERGRQPEATPMPSAGSQALRGTIGQMVTIEGMQLMQVSGFGLVVNLVDTGGRDGPDEIRNYLLKEIRRRETPNTPVRSASDILEDLDTVMVEVTGYIPAAARKGDRFDVMVKALGSECSSIVGGRLFLCELKQYASTPSGLLGGKSVATAAGPIFVSPFTLEGKRADKVDLRSGVVLGGGVVTEERKIRLVLNHPSYGDARAIVDRLNSRYRIGEQVAVAQSGSFVELNIPDEYREQKRWFLERVAHTHRVNSPGPLERLSAELKREFAQPDASWNDIGLAWEAIGDEFAKPHVQEFYEDKNISAAYHAGRTGLRLKDEAGMEVVARCARDPESPFRTAAIEELGRAYSFHHMYRAGQYLSRLLHDPDHRIRIMAYRALRQAPHPAIRSRVLDDDNLILDLVDSTAEEMIYIQQAETPRIALFAPADKPMRCLPPAIFPAETQRGRVILTQLSASSGDDGLKVIYTDKRDKKSLPALSLNLDVAELIAFLGDTLIRDLNLRPQGLGVPYSEIVDILECFCRFGTIHAKLVVEDVTTTERAQFDAERERPESEL